jgi:tryptophan halogenase
MMGQGITPQRYHNIADAMSRQQLDDFLKQIQGSVNATVAALPKHGDFVKKLVAMAKV